MYIYTFIHDKEKRKEGKAKNVTKQKYTKVLGKRRRRLQSNNRRNSYRKERKK